MTRDTWGKTLIVFVTGAVLFILLQFAYIITSLITDKFNYLEKYMDILVLLYFIALTIFVIFNCVRSVRFYNEKQKEWGRYPSNEFMLDLKENAAKQRKNIIRFTSISVSFNVLFILFHIFFQM